MPHDLATKRGTKTRPRSLTLSLAVLAGLVWTAQSCAQEVAPQLVADTWEKLPPSSGLATALCGGIDPLTTTLASRARIPLYRMMPGFLSDPANFSAADDASSGFLVNFGDDNPFLDPRRPGDPGGVGYSRLFSQMQVMDTGSTSVCLGLKAWTPAGVENGGLGEGHTYLAPGLGVFQDLGSGSGLHGFVGQQFCADVHGTARQSAMACGMAVHCPVPGLTEPTTSGVYLYVQALGRYGYQNYAEGREMDLELVPGIHWRLSDNLWMSLDAARKGMLTCSWQY
jgi:hypothetical protein